jgi:hypothetical protein
MFQQDFNKIVLKIAFRNEYIFQVNHFSAINSFTFYVSFHRFMCPCSLLLALFSLLSSPCSLLVLFIACPPAF